MNIEEAKKIIKKKAPSFKEKNLKRLDAFWEIEQEIDYFSTNTKVKSYAVFHITIVDGNFEVDDLLEDAENDHSLLIVLGDLIVNQAIIMSQVVVTGNLIIKNIAVFDSMGDYSLCVDNNISAKYYINSDHIVEVKGKWTLGKSYERGQDPNGILVPECIEDGEYHNFTMIAKRVRANLPVFI